MISCLKISCCVFFILLVNFQFVCLFLMIRRPPRSKRTDTLFPNTTLFRADFEVTGSHAGEIDGRDEQAVLLALSDPSRSHAFCVVQGEPGSGKSHLIRWLFVNWLQSDDIKLLLQRADGSLEGALRQLREQIGRAHV